MAIKKSERTRQRIVESANRLFYRQGFHNTSFTDVVAASGVPRGNIYYYFKTKDEILLAAIDYRLERIKVMLEGWSETYRTPLERLHRFIALLDDTAEALTQFGCPMGSLNAELGKANRALQHHAAQLFALFEDWLTDQFAELGYAGRARELALRLISIGQGISMLTHVHHDADWLRSERRRLRRWLDQLAEGDESCL